MTDNATSRQLFRTLNRFVAPIVRAGAGNPLPIGVGAVVVSTTGRETGETRETPLLAARLGPAIATSTVRRRSQWIENVRADPEVEVHLFGRTRRGSARVLARFGISVAMVRLGE